MSDAAAPVGDAAPGTRRPRTYSLALALLAVGAGLLFVASGRTWATVVVGAPGQPTITVEVVGRDLTYGAPLALLALAGIAGLVALRRAGRIAAGAVLLLCATGAVLSVVVFATTHASATGDGGRIAGVASERAGIDVAMHDIPVTSWWLVELVAAVLVATAGALAVVTSRDWPVLGRRYERPSGGGTASTGPPDSSWDQLDQGIDPTIDPVPDARPATTADGTNLPT